MNCGWLRCVPGCGRWHGRTASPGLRGRLAEAVPALRKGGPRLVAPAALSVGKGRRGASVIELSIAVAVSGILMLGVVGALVGGAQMSVAARQHLALRQDASYALQFIARRVRGALTSGVSVSEDGRSLYVEPETGATLVFEQDGADLVFSEGDQATVLLDGKVGSIAFTLTPGENGEDWLLDIALVLAEGDRQSALPPCRVWIRNRPDET